MLGMLGCFSSPRQERKREIMSGEKTTKGIVSKAWVGQKVQESVQGVCVVGESWKKQTCSALGIFLTMKWGTSPDRKLNFIVMQNLASPQAATPVPVIGMITVH